MKLALVTPPWARASLYRLRYGYHLVEATHLSSPRYRKMYQQLHKAGHFIILDNGAAEATRVKHGHAFEPGGVVHSEPMLFEDVLAYARKLNADEIILPDRKLDMEWTAENTPYWAATVPKHKRAIVPQGKNFEEWFTCLDRIVMDIEFATICITKDYEELPGGRYEILSTLQAQGIHKEYNIHLLGVKGPDIQAELGPIANDFPWVRGIDTGAPIAYAQNDANILDPRVHYSMDWNDAIVYDREFAAKVEWNAKRLQEWICT